MNSQATASLLGAASDGQTAAIEPYFIGLNRAMISLGPLTEGKAGRRIDGEPEPLTSGTYCTYKCTFCYVNGPYQKYAKRSVEEILAWLQARTAGFDMIYVSGDTDSFAPPRTAEALRLLEGLLPLGHDVLFTTRYVFSADERTELLRIQAEYLADKRLLIPCISVSQLAHPGLEPHPIPSPEERLAQIEWLHRNGFKVILTIRPFLPYVDATEYVEIARRGGPHCSAILGGNWYTDPGGIIDEKTRLSVGSFASGLSLADARKGPLDSAMSDLEWLESPHPLAERLVAEEAELIGTPFFMRSTPAIEHLRSLP